MRVYSIKFGLLSAVWLYSMITVTGGPVITNALDQRRSEISGTVRQESGLDGKILAQNPSSRPRQTQDELPSGKKKSLHEYGPEQLIPEPDGSIRSVPNSRSKPERV